MDSKQIELVQTSFAKVAPIADTAASLFYGRLFELDPSLKPLFKSDMTEQGKKLMMMLGAAVHNLNKLDEVVPAVEALAVRHVRYNVTPEMYDTVGEALLWTLGQGLGDDFTPEVEAAWTEVYITLATVMKTAAYTPTTD